MYLRISMEEDKRAQTLWEINNIVISQSRDSSHTKREKIIVHLFQRIVWREQEPQVMSVITEVMQDTTFFSEFI